MVQSLHRALSVLQRLAAADKSGLRLLDLQTLTGFPRPTVHRLLAALIREGFVTQDLPTHRYKLGIEAAVMGWSALHQRVDLRQLSQSDMHELAQETGDTAFLTIRSGYDTVCIERCMGPYPIRAFTVDVGTRRPLGVGAGAVALLSCLDEHELNDIYAVVAARLAAFPNVTISSIRRSVAACRRDGHGLSDGQVMDGIRALGVPIVDPKGWPVAAVSIAAIRQRIDTQRVPLLVAALQRCRRAIERRLARPQPQA